MLSHYAQLSSSMHARLFGSMQQHACLSGGARSLRSNFCLSLPVYMHRLSSLCAHGLNNGTEVCVSSECPGETAQTSLSCRCRITDSFVLLMHVFQIALAISCLKKTPILARYQSIFYTY